MAGFADLPNELVLVVLKMVLPEDLENFAQMSKHVFLMARPVLEPHRRLIRLHTAFSSHPPPGQARHTEKRDGFLVGPVPTLFRAIVNERLIGHYIREVKLDKLLKVRSRMTRNWSDEAQALYNRQQDLVDTAVAQSGVPNIQSFYDLHRAGYPTPRNSHEELLVALLLPLLPNLNTLSLTWDSDMNYFPQMIRHSALNGNPWSANLKTVHLEECNRYRRLWLRDLSLFTSLPTLRSLTAVGVYGGEENIEEFLPAQDSHTKDLKLFRTQIRTLPLYWYLESFQSLQTFTFEYAYPNYSAVDKEKFDPCWIQAALVAHTKTTLQSLTILGPNRPNTFMSSLQAFEALREIHTQWVFLSPRHGCHQTWPSRVLPASLRRLELHANWDHTPVCYKALFRGLRRAREKICSHLELVNIGTFWDKVHMAAELDDLYIFCKEEGISLTFQEAGESLTDPEARMFLTFGAES